VVATRKDGEVARPVEGTAGRGDVAGGGRHREGRTAMEGRGGGGVRKPMKTTGRGGAGRAVTASRGRRGWWIALQWRPVPPKAGGGAAAGGGNHREGLLSRALAVKWPRGE
jgi:hypothetical protein